MANPFVHVELHTNDLAKAKAFYSRLFGWKLQDTPMPGGAPPHWLAYVGVDDVSTSTRNARELGAKVVMDKTEVGDFGWMSVITDPTGATFALWQPKEPQKK